jgi:hypothetical protein
MTEAKVEGTRVVRSAEKVFRRSSDQEIRTSARWEAGQRREGIATYPDRFDRSGAGVSDGLGLSLRDLRGSASVGRERCLPLTSRHAANREERIHYPPTSAGPALRGLLLRKGI